VKLQLLSAVITLSTLLVQAQLTPDVQWEGPLSYGYVITDIAVSPDGDYAACPRNAGVAIRRVADGSSVTNLDLGGSYVSAIRFSPDGLYLAAAGSGGARVWKVADWSVAYTPPATAPIAFSPDSTMLATVVGSEIQLRSATNGAVLQSWTNPPTAILGVGALAFSPDSTMLASGAGTRGSDTNLTLWSMPAGTLIRTVPTAQTYTVGNIRFSPDGKWATTAGGPYVYGPAQLWRVSDWQLMKTFPGGAYSAPFTPDGTALAVIGTDISFYSVPAGNLIRHYSDSANGSHYQKALAFTPDGVSYLRVCYPEIFCARTPFIITSFQRENSDWRLSWLGGQAPFTIQECTNLLESSWHDIAVPTPNRTLSLPITTGNALYRVLSGPELP